MFLRVGFEPSSGPALFWDDPSTLLRRSDWYAYSADHFGSLNPQSGHSTSGMTRDPAKVAGFGGGSNEVMFKNGIDLLGEEAPSLIRCSSAAPARRGAGSARGQGGHPPPGPPDQGGREVTDWETRLAGWLAGGEELDSGAEIEVRELDGTVAFLAPLARHYRVDGDTLWIRPVVGGYVPPGGMPYAFSLNAARARALPLDDVRLEGDEIVIPAGADQVAHLRPAGPETLAELERWDTSVLTALDAEEEAALDRVEGDSWWGRWA